MTLAFFRRYAILFFCLVSALVLTCLLYHPPSEALVAMDASISGMKNLREMILGGQWIQWNNDWWLGSQGAVIFPSINIPIIAAFPVPYCTTMLFAGGFFLSGFGMYVLLRRLGLGVAAAFFGGISMLLTNTTFTLVYAGHINKVYTYPWLIFASLFFLNAVHQGSWIYYIASGIFLGIAVLSGEIQVAFYLGLWFVVWTAIAPVLTRPQKGLRKALLRGTLGIIVMVTCTCLVGYQSLSYHAHMASDHSPLLAENTASANWKFATQFYFPPEEMLSYFTTIQFFGGPHAYWGRDGLPNPLRLSDDYMGLLPLGFAILGGITCWRIWQARLFVIMSVGSLFISFGRDGGLFWLLYQLPTMQSQRNPHRWSYFVSFAVCVLGAYGVDWLWKKLKQEREKNHKAKTSSSWQKPRICLLGTFVLGSILFAVASSITHDTTAIAQWYYGATKMSSSDGPLFLERSKMMISSLWRTGLFLALSAGSIWWIISINLKTQPSRLKSYLPWAVLLLVLVFDLGSNAKRYVKFFPWKEYFSENELINLLKSDSEHYRVKVIGTQQVPLLNDLVTHFFPFHKVSVVDHPTPSRLPEPYPAFFNYLQNHFSSADRYYDMFNVKYLLSPSPLSGLGNSFSLAATFGDIHLYKRSPYFPRAWMVHSSKVVGHDSDTILFETFHPSLKLQNTVVLEEEIPGLRILPSATTPAATPLAQSSALLAPKEVSITSFKPNEIQVHVRRNPALGMLVMSDKWDADWHAWVDQQPTKIYRANFLMRAVIVPPGDHTIRFSYQPSRTGFWVSTFSVTCFALLGTFFAMTKLPFQHGTSKPS